MALAAEDACAGVAPRCTGALCGRGPRVPQTSVGASGPQTNLAIDTPPESFNDVHDVGKHGACPYLAVVAAPPPLRVPAPSDRLAHASVVNG